MVRIFASRLGRLLFGIWVVMLVTSVSGLNMVPAASKNTNGGTSSGTTTSSKPSKRSRSCTTNAPRVFVENNWAWGSPGSWGLAVLHRTCSPFRYQPTRSHSSRLPRASSGHTSHRRALSPTVTTP